MSRQISRADIAAGCAKILSKWRYRLWGLKEKGIRRKAAPPRREERHEGERQNWNFFARATTQQLIKSLNVSLSGWCCCCCWCCPSLAFFSQYKLPLPPLRLRLTTASFSIHPDTGSTPSPLAEMLTAGNFYPEKLGALLRSSSSRYPSRYREASMRVTQKVS